MHDIHTHNRVFLRNCDELEPGYILRLDLPDGACGSLRAIKSVAATPHPNGKTFAGGPQMVEISRDGKRVYWTNSLYSTWDDQFYPGGVPAAQVMALAEPGGGLALSKDYWVGFPDGYRAHQVRLEGGDCSTDSFCYPSV
jgi:selenium-binding protein 1